MLRAEAPGHSTPPWCFIRCKWAARILALQVAVCVPSACACALMSPSFTALQQEVVCFFCCAVLCPAVLGCLFMQACAGADVGLVFVGSSMVELKKSSDGDFKPATEGEGLGEWAVSNLPAGGVG